MAVNVFFLNTDSVRQSSRAHSSNLSQVGQKVVTIREMREGVELDVTSTHRVNARMSVYLTLMWRCQLMHIDQQSMSGKGKKKKKKRTNRIQIHLLAVFARKRAARVAQWCKVEEPFAVTV